VRVAQICIAQISNLVNSAATFKQVDLRFVGDSCFRQGKCRRAMVQSERRPDSSDMRIKPIAHQARVGGADIPPTEALSDF
jgi:hypothetical protein